MANDQIKKADNGTYYFRANLGFDHSTGKRIGHRCAARFLLLSYFKSPYPRETTLSLWTFW